MQHDPVAADTSNGRRLLTSLEAAKYLDIRRTTVYAAVRAGNLTATEIRPWGTREQTYRFTVADLDAYRERVAAKRERWHEHREAVARCHARANYVKLPHLREWRLARGLRAVELAYRAYVTPAWVYALEAGRYGARMGDIHLLALALDVASSTLINRAPAAHELTVGTTRMEAPGMAATAR